MWGVRKTVNVIIASHSKTLVLGLIAAVGQYVKARQLFKTMILNYPAPISLQQEVPLNEIDAISCN